MITAEASASELLHIASRMLGSKVTYVRRIGEGRNSQVYRIGADGPEGYVLKFYPPAVADNHRNRLDVEFTCLKYLSENGVTCVPRPVVADRDRRCALYEYVDGERVPDSGVAESDIDQAVAFLARLRDLSLTGHGKRFPPAGEAWWSIQTAFGSIQRRLDRLRALAHGGPELRRLQDFLRGEFEPSLREVKRWCTTKTESWSMSMDSELESPALTLSPSDFGFHNVLRRKDGQIVFLDFEYFGWDDPAKTVSDFLTHPAMDLNQVWKRRFLDGTVECFQDLDLFARRVEVLYPLAGLKWCLLLLNEFLPEHIVIRGFAKPGPLDEAELQDQQLAKATNMLQRVKGEYQSFPFTT